MSFSVIHKVLATDLANGGTVTFAYPTGLGAGSFEGHKHTLVTPQANFASPASISVSFGASEITVTYNGATTIPAGSAVALQVDRTGHDGSDPYSYTVAGVQPLPLALLEIGAAIPADVDSLIDAATGSELPNAETVTYTFPDDVGTSPVDGANTTGVLDVARNVLVTVTHGSSIVAMTVVVHGKDVYEQAMSESLTVTAGGTSKAASTKKTFKQITSIDLVAAGDAEANTVDVGHSDVFGLPAFLPGTGYVLKELEDGAEATAGTILAGVQVATATSGDVRGTYDPNSAADGQKHFALLVALPDATDRGVAQYSA